MPSNVVKPAGIWKSEAFLRTLLIAGSVIFVWAMVELPAFFNVLDYQALQLSGAWGSMRFIRIPDSELLYREPPHARHAGSAIGGDFPAGYQVPLSDQNHYRWDLRYDQNGFRNDTDLKSAGIVVIGDSMVEGMTVPRDQLITTHLERAENQPVANFGEYGYGPGQEIVVLKRYALQMRPRVVIWVFSEGTDLDDLPGYRRAIAHPQSFWDRFVQRSFTRVVYRGVSHFFAPAKPLGISRSGAMQRPDGTPVNVYFTFKPHSLTAEDLKAADGTGDIITQAYKLSAAQGARFLFVFAPDKFRVYRDVCQFPAQSECGRWVVTDLPERMRKIVTSIAPDIGYLDLTPALADAAKHGMLPYYPDDVHWTPDGHKVAAEAIENYLSGMPAR
jgi:hypothetical protein